MQINKYWQTAFYIDKKLSSQNVTYSIIKSYRDISYSDGNLDLVVEGSLIKFYENHLSDDFFLKKRDKIKARYYERNKLMCSSKSGKQISIHLHSNVGWHDCEFFSYDRIIEMSERVKFTDFEVVLTNKRFESEVLFLHCFFEKNNFSKLDIEFIGNLEMKRLTKNYLGIDDIKWVNHKNAIPFHKLFTAWTKYYSKSRKVNLKNLFFHFMLLIRQIIR